MKKFVFYLGFGLLSLSIFLSCLKDENDIFVSYGVIRNVISDNNYEILTDKGNTLKVLKSFTRQEIENDKRVLVNYEILSDKEKNKQVYDVSVNGFYNLLSKPVVFESFIKENEQERRDSIGNDPFNRIGWAFGGNYINIDFEIMYVTNSGIKHMINLVYDDLRADADTIYLTLYQNAYGETWKNKSSLQKGVGRSSFLISDLLPSGVSSKPVKITWTEYFSNNESRVCSDSGLFNLQENSTNESFDRLAQHIGFDSSIEVK
jgi:hypothetical protein